jgi:hypothetical protein
LARPALRAQPGGPSIASASSPLCLTGGGQRHKDGQAWQIAISSYGAEDWHGLSSKDQQRSYWEDLAKGLARKENSLESFGQANQRREAELFGLIGEVQILPGWLHWLRLRIGSRRITDQEVESAVKYSQENRDLLPGRGSWELGGYFSMDDLE